MAAPAAYATRAQFERSLGGSSRVRELFAGIEHEELGSHLDDLLAAASGRINEAAGQSGYAVPLDPAVTLSGSALAQANGLLMLHTCWLAASSIGASMEADLPDGIASAAKRSEAWLELLRTGKASLPGLARTEAGGSRIAFVPVGGPSRIDPGIYHAQRNIIR